MIFGFVLFFVFRLGESYCSMAPTGPTVGMSLSLYTTPNFVATRYNQRIFFCGRRKATTRCRGVRCVLLHPGTAATHVARAGDRSIDSSP